MQLKSIRVCGPRYWPQVIEFVPEGRDATALTFYFVQLYVICNLYYLKFCSERPPIWFTYVTRKTIQDRDDFLIILHLEGAILVA